MNPSDERLIANAGAGQSIPLEMMRRLKNSVDTLDKSINTLNRTASKQQKIMIGLTITILILTIAILFL